MTGKKVWADEERNRYPSLYQLSKRSQKVLGVTGVLTCKEAHIKTVALIMDQHAKAGRFGPDILYIVLRSLHYEGKKLEPTLAREIQGVSRRISSNPKTVETTIKYMTQEVNEARLDERVLADYQRKYCREI
jgi:hypothetical protein